MTALYPYALFLHLVHLCGWSFCMHTVHSKTQIKSTSRCASKQKQKINEKSHSYYLASHVYDTYDLIPGICILNFYQEERLREGRERQASRGRNNRGKRERRIRARQTVNAVTINFNLCKTQSRDPRLSD